MAITKYESYYFKILEKLKLIKEENEYETNSLAFAHWYLENYYKLSAQNIAEIIIDGDGDLGIDAILIDEDSSAITVMQFKLPSKKENINSEIDQGDILKTWNGFLTLISNDKQYTGKNEKFKDFKRQLENTVITKFRICFVGYNKGVVANRDIIENNAEDFKRETGSDLEIIYHDRDAISNIYEKLNRKNNISITLKYKQMQSAYNVQGRKIDSFVGFVNGIELVESISGSITTIFDENIRLYEYGSNVNMGINRTATSTEQADMFYFYNNGVVFICDKAKNSPASSEIILEGASVVNGCQTVNVLYNAKQKGKLNDSVYVLVRIISIADYSERMKITEYLNSQTPIRDSYFIANHPIIRDLQQQLLKCGYFLERQINEADYMKEHGEPIKDNVTIQLENAIQYYVGYYDNKNASLAKRGKNALFDKKMIEELLSGITADKVIEAYTTYQSIAQVLTLYRKTRRNAQKDEFSKYMGISQAWLLGHIEDFRFMNTGDIILLNAYANLKEQYERLGLSGISEKEIIRDAIFVVCKVMASETDSNASLLTKNSNVFSKVQGEIGNLTQRYEHKEC